jgi:hypothetical protein
MRQTYGFSIASHGLSLLIFKELSQSGSAYNFR